MYALIMHAMIDLQVYISYIQYVTAELILTITHVHRGTHPL